VPTSYASGCVLRRRRHPATSHCSRIPAGNAPLRRGPHRGADVPRPCRWLNASTGSSTEEREDHERSLLQRIVAQDREAMRERIFYYQRLARFLRRMTSPGTRRRGHQRHPCHRVAKSCQLSRQLSGVDLDPWDCLPTRLESAASRVPRRGTHGGAHDREPAALTGRSGTIRRLRPVGSGDGISIP
jgi:hypothetical protein